MSNERRTLGTFAEPSRSEHLAWAYVDGRWRPVAVEHLGRLCGALDDLADRLAAEIERLRAENADLIRSVSDVRAIREQLGADALADERAHADRLAELLALHGCEDPIVLDLLAAHQARRGDA